MRQLGIVCTAPVMGGAVTSLFITLRTPLYSGTPNWVVGDSVLVWNEGNPASRTDDGWLRGRVTQAAANQACTDLSAGVRIRVDFQPTPFPAPMVNLANPNGVPLGAPLRGFEIVTYKVRQAADNRWYLHLTTTNGSGTTGPTPIVGPLTGSTGVVFTYFNSAGAATAVLTQVAQIGVTIRGQSLRQVHLPGIGVGFKAESLATRITLRNNPRF